jgi:D-alanyl-D-alanine carboxypeptidase/D-alanyl-D-alanine-endopeptidase (penicillin-binding protein 4)
MIPNRARSSTLIFFLCLWAWLFPLQLIHAHEPEQSLAELIRNGGFVVTSKGSINNQLKSHSPFVPASIIKIATSLVALELLGSSYHYTTEFYLKDETKLYIKGYGDPFLSSEYISDIARELRNRNISHIDEIVVDGSSFSIPAPADGTEGTDNPYDVSNSALAVNFNTLSIQVNKDRSVVSGESQTPLLQLTQFIGGQLEPGRHRVNVSAFDTEKSNDNSLRYTGELFAAFLTREGVTVRDNIRSGLVDDSCILIYSFTNPKSVMELVKDCLEFSNNFIANQLFLSCGTALFGYPATWEKGRLVLVRTLEKNFSINCRTMKIREGSGLSRRTRVTPFFMLSVLRAFRPYRLLLPQKNGMNIKSGTLTDVYTYAGYFNSPESSDPFVIMLNQTENSRQRVLESLHQKYRQSMQVTRSSKTE